jgi:hypothetical protein
MHLQKDGENFDWIHPAWDEGMALFIMAMNLWVP